MRLLESIGQPNIPGRSPNAMFSLLAPNTRIPPHHGVANTRLVCHLPLVVPPNCWFRSGAETRRWNVGKAFVFDDTIEHEAANDSGALARRLHLRCLASSLGLAEREAVAAMMGARRPGIRDCDARLGDGKAGGGPSPASPGGGGGPARSNLRRALAVSLAKAGEPKAALAQ